MEYITFLLGAGASAQSLPIVNQIPERLLKIHSILETKKR